MILGLKLLAAGLPDRVSQHVVLSTVESTEPGGCRGAFCAGCERTRSGAKPSRGGGH